MGVLPSHCAHLSSADWAQLQCQLCATKTNEELGVLGHDVLFDALADNTRMIDRNIKLLSEALMKADDPEF